MMSPWLKSTLDSNYGRRQRRELDEDAPLLLMKANEGCSSDLLSSLHPSITEGWREISSWVNLDYRRTSNSNKSVCVCLITKSGRFPDQIDD